MRWLLTLLLAATAWAQPFRVAGVVVDAVTQAPLAQVALALAAVDGSGPGLRTVTGSDGRFVFEPVPAGKYELRAERRGMGSQAYGQPRYGSDYSRAIITGPGKNTEQLVFRYVPPGVLRGKVVDARGEPVEGALVQLTLALLDGGVRLLVPAGTSRTDDRGIYRLAGLRAGEYYVSVAGQPWFTWAGYGLSVTGQAYPTTYHPGSVDPRGARPVVVRPGGELTADFTLYEQAAGTVKVRWPEAPGTLTLWAETVGPEGSLSQAFVSQVWGTNHLVKSLAPGQYRFRLRCVNGSELRWAEQDVPVAGGEQQVEMSWSGLAGVEGTVRLEGGKKAAQAVLLLVHEGAYGSLASPIAPDGGFRFSNVRAGRYRLVLPAGTGLHLRSVQAEGAAMREGWLEVPAPGSVRLSVDVYRETGRLRGLVPDGADGRGHLIVLLPQPLTENWAAYQSYWTDADGSFEFASVPVGRYVLVVVPGSEDPEYTRRDVAERLAANGVAIQVKAGATLELGEVNLKGAP